MGDYDNTNSGALFVNNRKSNDRQPDRNGSINVDGVDYWISGWLKEGRSGQYLSLAVTRKDDDSNSDGHPSDPASKDGVPF